MEKTDQTSQLSQACSYCGEAPVNHKLQYFENVVNTLFDSWMAVTLKYTPKAIKEIVDWVPVGLFNGLNALGLAHFSTDITKAHSFRSQVIWEEANRRGIVMEQVIVGKRPLEWYRARLPNKTIYFESIPIQSEFLDGGIDWDNKIILKKKL